MLNTAQPLDLLDRVSEGIFALDADWRFSYLNRHAERVLARLTGSPSADLLGTIIWERPALADSSLGRALHRAHVDQIPVIHEILDSGTRGTIEVRAYPSEDGLTVLLRESALQGHTAQILDAMGEAFLGCDHEWHITHINERADRYLSALGFRRAGLLGVNVWQAFPILAGTRIQAEAFRAHAQGTEVQFDEYLGTSDRRFSIRIAPTSSGLVCYAREVADNAPNDIALHASEQRFRSLVESIDDVVFRLDRNQRCVDAFGRWLERQDFSPADLIGKTIAEIVGPEAAQPHEAANLQALNGETVTYEWVLKTGDGTHHMQTTLSPLRDADGDVTGIVGVGRDVTQRIEAGRELQRWSRIFEHAGWGVAIVSPDGQTIESVNPAFALMHGWTVDELRGKPMAELAVLHRRSEFLHENGALRTTGHQIWETERLHRTGISFPALIDATAVKDGDGQVICYAVNVQDLTERRRAEEQVRQAQKMEAVGRLAGGVAHDFNNMMMIIMGFSDFLLSTLPQDDARWADADEIRKAAERAMHLTRQLLGFGRQQLVARSVLSLNEVVSGMERMLRPVLGEDIRLVTRLSVGLGGIEADYGQLEQVVMNLALNARDAMREHGGRLTLETLDVDLPEGYGYKNVGIDIPAGQYVMLVVSDTGQGMTSEVRNRLFEPFFTTKPATQNTGLGLATVYGIVIQSGGYLWVDSEMGKGTVFTICFPRIDADGETTTRPVPRMEPTRGSETILLIEDEQAVRTVATRVLKNSGYFVLAACSGEEALALADQADGSIDMVLTDVIMPDMAGPEVVEQMIKRWPSLKVLYMSGYAQGDKARAQIFDPETSFLQKPFSADNLVRTVRKVFDRGTTGA
ncbi:MAG TPA: PAS domain-containing protein [Gemmatimonadales bacterium]|nr:PAS domain-containing protein [Gemmatimonadales bacterium]